MFFHKTGCARQSESKLSLRSLALFLNKTGCARQSESKLSLRSLALFFNKRDGILRILHRYSSRRMSGRFVTAVFTCLCNSLSHNGLRNGLSGLAKEAFPHHERASSAVSKSLFRSLKEALSQARKARFAKPLWHSVLRNGAETARDLCLTSLSIVLCGMCGGTAFRRAGDSGHMLRSA